MTTQDPPGDTPQKFTFSKLPTAFTDHDYFTEKPYDHGRALADIATVVARRDHTARIAGHRIALKAGEFPGAVRFLAERWGWSKDKVHLFMQTLQADGILTKVADGKPDGSPTVYRVVAAGLYGNWVGENRTLDRTPTGRWPDKAVDVREVKDEIKSTAAPAGFFKAKAMAKVQPQPQPQVIPVSPEERERHEQARLERLGPCRVCGTEAGAHDDETHRLRLRERAARKKTA